MLPDQRNETSVLTVTALNEFAGEVVIGFRDAAGEKLRQTILNVIGSSAEAGIATRQFRVRW